MRALYTLYALTVATLVVGVAVALTWGAQVAAWWFVGATGVLWAYGRVESYILTVKRRQRFQPKCFGRHFAEPRCVDGRMLYDWRKREWRCDVEPTHWMKMLHLHGGRTLPAVARYGDASGPVGSILYESLDDENALLAKAEFRGKSATFKSHNGNVTRID